MADVRGRSHGGGGEGGCQGGENGLEGEGLTEYHACQADGVCVCFVCLRTQVYNVHYSMSINGKVEEGTMEIDTANNMERFSTGSGADEAVEVHDFQIVSPNPTSRRSDMPTT